MWRVIAPGKVVASRMVVWLLVTSACGTASAAEPDPRVQEAASRALRRAVQYFTEHVASHGGYLWRYSVDLKLREGEGKAGPETVWVQPPGTPSVGMAYLDAYEATSDRFYLDAARAVGDCLVRGQLRSGGWDYRIEFDPKARERYNYRVDPPRPKAGNTTTLDDNTTQSAVQFLMRLDKTLGFRDQRIHEAVEYALQSLIGAQYPNGAWPQRFREPPDPKEFPVLRASYPAQWSRTHPGEKYYAFYTFNDNAIADTIDVMLQAYWTYRKAEYRESARRAGQFILLAQMPDPQPAWAQQYDRQMHPAWARRFEPPAITGGESQGVLQVLLKLYRETGDEQFLEPVPRALEYLRRSQLPDGRLARFYELKTNRPLYFTRDYRLTYDDSDVPTHYAFKVDSRLDRIQQEYDRLRQLPKEQLARPPQPERPRWSRSLESLAKRAAESLDEQGRWVERGTLRSHGKTTDILDTRTFIRNVQLLSRYLAATQSNGMP